MRKSWLSRTLAGAFQLTLPFCLATFARAQDTTSSSVENEVKEIRSENALLREQLRILKEQQEKLLSIVGNLQRRLDEQSAAVTQPVLAPSAPARPQADIAHGTTSASRANDVRNTPQEARASAKTPIPPASVDAPQPDDDPYRQNGAVIVQTSDEAKVPFLLNFNLNTQIRYLNTLDSRPTFTDHLGNIQQVHRRQDITVNRAMIVLGGYIFDKRALYSFTVWTSAGSASLVIAGNIGWRFNKAITLTGGYTGVPGSRSLVNTFPYFTAQDRSMADNFFRPGFTQGVWLSGEPLKGLNYLAFVGNGINTLNVSANKIDTNLLFSGSVWWEPLGRYGEPGKSLNMYDDYSASKNVRIRLGTAFTRSRENRFSANDQSSPDNTSIYNSDGVQAFATGAFARDVTLQDATYKMWATDWGLKWKGFAVNGQYFVRWLSDFVADGPLPLKSTFDHGAEASVSYYVKPKTFMPYIRGSWVRGQFNNPYEYGAGLKWYYLRTDRLWVTAELFRVVGGAPYSGTFTPYTAGMNGWVPMLQAYIAF